MGKKDHMLSVSRKQKTEARIKNKSLSADLAEKGRATCRSAPHKKRATRSQKRDSQARREGTASSEWRCLEDDWEKKILPMGHSDRLEKRIGGKGERKNNLIDREGVTLRETILSSSRRGRANRWEKKRL